MRAVLAFDRFESKKHSGVISAFRKDYIKTGIFPVELSDIIEDAFEIRNDSDYDDFYVISKNDVATQIENAKTFLTAVEEYITSKTQNQWKTYNLRLPANFGGTAFGQVFVHALVVLN